MPEPILRLGPRDAFAALGHHEKNYAFHLARAAWHGAAIVMRQTSAESRAILDLILELHRTCEGEWPRLAEQTQVSEQDLEHFLDYASSFLSNIGNYYGTGDQKFIPKTSAEVVGNLASASPTASRLLAAVSDDLFKVPPYNLGFPSENAQSQYYVDSSILTHEEQDVLGEVMSSNKIFPENTRLHRTSVDSKPRITILQASIEKDPSPTLLHEADKFTIWLKRGDHSEELTNICAELDKAIQYAADENQRLSLVLLAQSLRTGHLSTYRESLKKWVDYTPTSVEYIFGFVEPYRDPAGVKAEFEGVVGIMDREAGETVQILAANAPKIVARLPWVTKSEDKTGYGPFENSTFKPPSFVCMQILAYCSSIIFPGINLPNVRSALPSQHTFHTDKRQYNDIREQCGHKSFIVTDRMRAQFEGLSTNPFIPESEKQAFQANAFETYQLYVILHEFYGHPTGRLLVDSNGEKSALDPGDLPVSPLDGLPVRSWYKHGQSWTSVFGDLSTTVDECRCELVAAFLMDSEEMLQDLGYGKQGRPPFLDILYNLYQQIGTDGLYGLADYHPEDGSWGSAHSQAHFTMLQWLLREGQGVVTVERVGSSLQVHIDRSKIQTHGTPALADMLLRLHIYRCTADVRSCRQLYAELSAVSGECLSWYDIVKRTLPPKKKFVQPNIVFQDGGLVLRHYAPTHDGVIQSWADRMV